MANEFVPKIEDALSTLSTSRVLLVLAFLKMAQQLESRASIQTWLGRALHDQIEELDGQDFTELLKVYEDALKLATLLEMRHMYATMSRAGTPAFSEAAGTDQVRVQAVKQIKFFEVRDHMTTIPMCAVAVEVPAGPSREHAILRRAGWNHERGIYMFHLGQDGMKVCFDPYTWGDRTRKTVHLYIKENWDNLVDGQLLDVRVILGETTEPCETEMG